MRRVTTTWVKTRSSVTSWVSGSLTLRSVNQSTAALRASWRMVELQDLTITFKTGLSTLAMKASHLTVPRAKHVRQAGAGQELGLGVEVIILLFTVRLHFVILEIVCDNIAQLKNGNMYLLSQDSWKKIILKTQTILHVGDMLEYECEEGFTLDGQAQVECLKDGTLSQSQPICQPVPCSQAPM